MLDIKFVRSNPEVVKQNIKNKFQDSKLPLVDEVLELDQKNREIKGGVEALRAEKNKTSKQIGAMMAQGKKEEAEELKKIELVINRIRMDMVKRGDMMSVEDVVDILAIDLIGVVPDDESIVIATNEGEPLVGSDTQAGKAFANICHRVLGEEVPIMEFEAESILKKIANLFKRGY